MYATYFEGDAAELLDPDTEARDLWLNLLPAERILPGNKKHNFWEMGESGPCGPCSEIHVDLRPEAEKKKIPGHQLVNADHPQVIEIWNLVFIQFNRDMQGKLHPLKNKHVDTGMGFERLCRVIQKKSSNYDTDVFTPIISKLETISGLRYAERAYRHCIRVVADHLRAWLCHADVRSHPCQSRYVIRRIQRKLFDMDNLSEPQQTLCH
jgi:alanyl-tRNA synthetase